MSQLFSGVVDRDKCDNWPYGTLNVPGIETRLEIEISCTSMCVSVCRALLYKSVTVPNVSNVNVNSLGRVGGTTRTVMSSVCRSV